MLDGIKSIFIPDAEGIKASFDSFVADLKAKFGFNTDFFNDIAVGESPVHDEYVNYNIPGVGAFRLKVFDSSFLRQGVEYFRPLIRGFLVLLMALYNVKQVLSFIRQDAGVVTGKVVSSGKGDGS